MSLIGGYRRIQWNILSPVDCGEDEEESERMQIGNQYLFQSPGEHSGGIVGFYAFLKPHRLSLHSITIWGRSFS